MLTNEKYMGDALLQKTFTMDFLTKKKVKNDGIAPQYYVENSHEAIIPKDLFMRTQEELRRRANLNSGTDRKKRIYSSKYALSSMVVCEHCGDIYRRIKWNNHGCKSTVWRCVSRVNKKTSGNDCPARTVREELLHEVVVEAINKVLKYDDAFFRAYRKGLETALGANNEKEIKRIESLLSEKQRELLSLSDNDKKYDMLAEEIISLREEKRQALVDDADRSMRIQKVDDLMEFVKRQGTEIEEYDESLVRMFIKNIIVHDDYFTVIFKSGMEIQL